MGLPLALGFSPFAVFFGFALLIAASIASFPSMVHKVRTGHFASAKTPVGTRKELRIEVDGEQFVVRLDAPEMMDVREIERALAALRRKRGQPVQGELELNS